MDFRVFDWIFEGESSEEETITKTELKYSVLLSYEVCLKILTFPLTILQIKKGVINLFYVKLI